MSATPVVRAAADRFWNTDLADLEAVILKVRPRAPTPSWRERLARAFARLLVPAPRAGGGAR